MPRLRSSPVRRVRRRLGVAGVAALAALLLVPVARLDAGDAHAGVAAATTEPSPALPPIVMVVLDELPTQSLLDERARIDRVRYPNFAALADDSIWFRGATTVSTLTHVAVPAILTGVLPHGRARPTAADHPRNLFTLLGDRYRMNVMETTTSLCAPPLCPRPSGARLAGPTGAAATPAKYREARRERFERFVRSLRADGARPTLNVLHSVLPHGPAEYFPSGMRYPPLVGTLGQPRDGGVWQNDSLLVRQAHLRHLLQVGFVDRLLGTLLARLKRTGLYDRALVVVTADHGISFRPGDDRRAPTSTNLAEVAYVPLLVKPPGRRGATIEDAHVETVDIVPTVADALGVPLPWAVDGTSVLRGPGSPLVRLPRQGVATDAALLEPLRQAALRRQVRLFGSRGNGSLFSGGEHGVLLGRRLTTLRRAESRGLRATIEHSTRVRLRSVNPRSGVLPALIGGRVEGPGASAGRTVTVALNGRIAAVTRTYSVGGAVRFAALVRESAFRRGANTAEVFAVESAGGRLRALGRG